MTICQWQVVKKKLRYAQPKLTRKMIKGITSMMYAWCLPLSSAMIKQNSLRAPKTRSFSPSTGSIHHADDFVINSKQKNQALFRLFLFICGLADTKKARKSEPGWISLALAGFLAIIICNTFPWKCRLLFWTCFRYKQQYFAIQPLNIFRSDAFPLVLLWHNFVARYQADIKRG